jgi:hypothetical protein
VVAEKAVALAFVHLSVCPEFVFVFSPGIGIGPFYL